jgi:hypothetical protein
MPLMITNRKLQAMFKLSPTILHTFIDMPNRVLEDRVQYPNYVTIVSD